MPLADLLTAPKTLDAIPNWNGGSDPLRFEFTQTLSVNGATIGGLILRGKARKVHIDRDVMFQLEYFSSGRTSVRLHRIDWRPFHDHTNDGNCPDSLEFEEFIGTHDHDFWLNYIQAADRMRSGNLPNARACIPEPTNYASLLDYCAIRLNIVNLTLLQPPQASTDMFRP